MYFFGTVLLTTSPDFFSLSTYFFSRKDSLQLCGQNVHLALTLILTAPLATREAINTRAGPTLLTAKYIWHIVDVYMQGRESDDFSLASGGHTYGTGYPLVDRQRWFYGQGGSLDNQLKFCILLPIILGVCHQRQRSAETGDFPFFSLLN